MGTKTSLQFTIQQQLLPTWCWSAVGTSIALFYNPNSGWTQCKMATEALLPAPGNCCNKPLPSPCNTTWFLQNADGTKGSLIKAEIANGFVAGAIPYDKLRTELDAGRIVAYRLQLEVEGQKMFHFVAAAGYDNSGDTPMVSIFDSFFGNSVMPYDEFIQHYKYQGFVTHSFFTIPQRTV